MSEENKEIHFDGTLPDSKTNEVRETEYVEERMISAENITEHMSENEINKFFINILRLERDAATDHLFEEYGKEKAGMLIRDFFKSCETWMRKHKVSNFYEQMSLIGIVNMAMVMARRSGAKDISKINKEEMSK